MSHITMVYSSVPFDSLKSVWPRTEVISLEITRKVTQTHWLAQTWSFIYSSSGVITAEDPSLDPKAVPPHTAGI